MINWINIEIKPEPGYYIIKYREYLGINIIYGFKIAKYESDFEHTAKQIIEAYATIPDTIPWKL